MNGLASLATEGVVAPQIQQSSGHQPSVGGALQTYGGHYAGQFQGGPQLLQGGLALHGFASPNQFHTMPRGGVVPAMLGRGGVHQFNAGVIPQDRMVDQRVNLGTVREIRPPETHIGLSLFPFMDVATDDVIFKYARGLGAGLAEARSQGAESHLARTDDVYGGEARSSVIDWSVKHHYTESDVARSRDWLLIQEQVAAGVLPLTASSLTENWQARLVRDTATRSVMLYNRLEKLIMDSLVASEVAYVSADGRIRFTVPWGRPAAQDISYSASNINGDAAYPIGDAWTASTSDPISDYLSIINYIYETYHVRIDRAIMSRKIANTIFKSDKFVARSGLITQSGSTDVDLHYVLDGWGPQAALAVVESQTQVKTIVYDSVIVSRAYGSTSDTITRFVPDNKIIFLPAASDLAAFDDTGLGLGRVLTSPHPAGNWSPGFYTWEKDFGVDPWGLDQGTGIKAFPIFPHMNKTFVYQPIA